MLIRKATKKAGLPPETMVHVGEKKTDRVKITLIDYDAETFEEKALSTPQECSAYRDAPTMTWINVHGVHGVEEIRGIGECFGLHPLVLEDIVNTQQRTKMDEFKDYIFLVMKIISYDEENFELKVEQFSLILGPNYVLTFQEKETGLFESLRERIRQHKGNIRNRGPDYLVFELLDTVVDHYFVALEQLGEDVEEQEEDLVASPRTENLQMIHQLKKNMIRLRRCVWPLREVIGGLERGKTDLVQEKSLIYFRDVYDHTIQIIETTEAFRDIVSGMLDIYLSSINNRMNEVMKVLTVIATIFIPLTFLTGIYGMNFHYMPELNWRWGYYFTCFIMVAIAVVMLVYFRRKKWL